MAFLKKTEARESTDNQVSISNRFRKLATSTLIATLLLILVGGLVRVSGAGLGCPDWPRCWGCWLPPADISVIDPVKYDISQYNKTKMWIEYANRMVGVV
ncbi:MAG: COX15/CtaA family protein, partial [Opitutae bacterium]